MTPRVRGRSARDDGFTLIELVITVGIIPIVVGSLIIGLAAAFSLQGQVSTRLGNSGDNQASTAVLNQDVTAAATITAQQVNPTPCGVGTQILGLTLSSGNTVSYNYQYSNPSSGQANLARDTCFNGVEISENVVAYNVIVASSSVAVTCNSLITSGGCTPATTALPANGVQQVALTITEPGPSKAKNYSFTLTSAPAASISSNPATLGSPTTGSSCDLALPGTGTYASTLCFLNFNYLNDSTDYAAATAASGLNLTEQVPGGYTLTFNVKVSGSQVVGAQFPTYSAAFFGNSIGGSPFYTGVGCADNTPTVTATGAGTPSCTDPAVYQPSSSSGGQTTVTLSNISLTTPQGTGATGYEVFTADAETTDPNESLKWTSNLPFHVISDTSASVMGDACNTETGTTPNAGGTDLTPSNLSSTVTSTTVTCASTWQTPSTTPRTGTLLLGLPSAIASYNGTTTITCVLKGAGLEGVSFGLLLP